MTAAVSSPRLRAFRFGLLGATSLAGLHVFFPQLPAWADGGRSGNTAVGGADVVTGPAFGGGSDFFGGGGGGGAGQTGGAGGNGRSGGGAGGQTPGAAGGAGATVLDRSGGGGGGGAHGYVGTLFPGLAVSGGAGGAGGVGDFNADAGGGGAGGWGAVVTGGGALGILTFNVTGGNGGNGGFTGGWAGSAGTGGVGLHLAGNAVTGTIAANVTGGLGGMGGFGGLGSGVSAVGGTGIVLVGPSSSLSITGAVTGGNGGNGANGINNRPGGDAASGGAGLIVQGADVTVTIGGSVTGGAGGAAGQGTGGQPNGAAGGGGHAILLNGQRGTITVNGTVTGGDGPVNAGVGIIAAADATVIVSGHISGGLGVGPNNRAPSIAFNGGANVLELRPGWSLTGNVNGAGAADTLRLGGSGNETLDATKLGAQLSGFGTLEKAGTSTWTLTGLNPFTQVARVNGGTLLVNNDFSNAASLTVNSGGFLGGTGTLPGTAIMTGGTLAPGNSIGTLTVNGNLTLNTGSTTEIEVQGNTSDRIIVTGTASLGGTLRVVGIGGVYTNGARYRFIETTGGATGTFATTTIVGIAGFRARVETVGNNVEFVLGAIGLTPSGGGGSGVLNVINNAFQSGGGGALQNLVNLTPGQQQQAVQQLGGVGGMGAAPIAAASAQGFTAAMGDEDESQSASIELAIPVQVASAADHLSISREAFQSRHAVWARPFGGFGAVRADAVAGAPGNTNSNVGMAVGMDTVVAPGWRVGFALAGAGGSVTVDQGLGSSNVGTFMGGLYANGRVGALQLSGSLAYGFNEITTSRTVSALAPGEIRGRLTAQTTALRAEAGWRFSDVAVRGVNLVPFLAYQASWTATPAYTETTTNAALQPAILNVAAGINATTRGEIGLGIEASLNANTSIFARGALLNYFARDANMTATITAAPGASFTTQGARFSPQAGLGSVGARFRIAPATTLSVRADLEAARQHTSANAQVRVTHRF